MHLLPPTCSFIQPIELIYFRPCLSRLYKVCSKKGSTKVFAALTRLCAPFVLRRPNKFTDSLTLQHLGTATSQKLPVPSHTRIPLRCLSLSQLVRLVFSVLKQRSLNRQWSWRSQGWDEITRREKNQQQISEAEFWSQLVLHKESLCQTTNGSLGIKPPGGLIVGRQRR